MNDTDSIKEEGKLIELLGPLFDVGETILLSTGEKVIVVSADVPTRTMIVKPYIEPLPHPSLSILKRDTSYRRGAKGKGDKTKWPHCKRL